MKINCKWFRYIIILIISLLISRTKCFKRIKASVPTEWVPEIIYNSTNFQSGLVDQEGYLKNFNKEKIFKVIDSLKKEKNIDVTMIYISSISKNYTSGSEKDIFRFVDELSALIVNRNRVVDTYSLIILFSIKDRQMRIRTGDEVRKVINDDKAAEFLESIKSELRREDYGNADYSYYRNVMINFKVYMNLLL